MPEPTERPFHFAGEIENGRYARTMCGIPMEQVDDADWTDAIGEVLEDLDNPKAEHPQPSSIFCKKCLTEAKEEEKRFKAESREYSNEHHREIAREEGMLNGIDSFNDWNTHFHSIEGQGDRL